MKKSQVAAIMLIVLSVWNSATSETIPKNTNKDKSLMSQQDKSQIEALLAEYKQSLNTSNATLAQSLYAKDGIFMPSGAPSAVGSDNILKSYEYIFSQIQLNIEFTIDEIIVAGDFAFATTSSKGTTLIRATGATVPEENRELFVFRKSSREWKIASYMFNKMK